MIELASDTKSSLFTIFDRRVLVLLALMVFIWSMRFNSAFSAFASLHILPEFLCMYYLGENMRRYLAVINTSLTEILITALVISACVIGVQVWILTSMRTRTLGSDFMMSTLTIGFLLSYYVGYFLYKKER